MKKQQYNRLNNIDGLRGWAILGVIAVHSTTLLAQYSSSSYQNYPLLHMIQLYIVQLMSSGRYGVQLFFLISGYILCYVYDQTHYSNRTFFLKRFFRLAPLYYLVLTLCYLFGYNELLEPGTRTAALNAKNFILHALFIHGLFPEYVRSIFSVSWSLTPEVVFYFFFPLLNKLSIKKIYILFILSFIMTYNYFLITELLFGSLDSTAIIWSIYSPIYNMFVFIFGMIVYKQPALFKSRISTAMALVFFAIFLISRYIITRYNFNPYYVFFGFNKYLLNYFFLFPIFPYLIYSNNRVKKYFTENKFIVSLGRVSYSAFFVHWAVVMLLNNYNIKFYGINALIVVLTITYIISSLTYKYIEVPGIRIGNKIINHWWPKRSETTFISPKS